MAKVNRVAGLSDREMVFLDHLHIVARIVATHGITFRQAITEVIEAFPDDQLDERKARVWIRKARHFISTGAVGDAESLRGDYMAKLDDLILKCHQNLVKDRTEVTVIRGIKSDGKPEEVPKSLKKKVVEGCFHPQVGQLLLKALKERAIVSGARPRESGGGRGPSVQNNQTNIFMPGASQTADLADERLVQMAFGDAVAVLPQSVGSPGPAGVPAPTPGAPEAAPDAAGGG